ncbi:MAG: transglutaminaseTgpA domain-containing protein [Gemmatimonadota bacterium]
MRLARTHRRLVVLMSLASLVAFASGAGVEPLSAILATAGLVLALFWHPSPALSARMERVWLPLALLLVVRALVHVFVIRDDVVIPVVDLLFLLLTAESLRSLDAANDARLYSLSFALLLASTAYRPGLLFLLAFLTFVSLATVVLIFGHLRRQAKRHGAGDIPVPRTFLLSATALSAVTLAVSALVFLTFPRVSQGWASGGGVLATSIAGFADAVTLGSHGGQIYGNPQIVLRVEFPGGVPSNIQSLYWRGRSYDRFDGQRWSKSPRLPPSLAPSAWYERWGTDVISQRVYGAPLDTQVLFALHPLFDVEPESPIQPISDNSGDYLYWGSGTPAYTAFSLAGRPSSSQLRTALGSFVPARAFYTQLPPLSPVVRLLADSLLSGLPTDYDRAMALESWFQQEFTYTLALPRNAREATLEHFLLNRRAGHCEYFSTAMAMLLRAQGIPVREVNGFVGGNWSEFGNYLAVTQNQAHAWVEVWFPGYGWVPFDPTLAGRGESLALNPWFWPGRFLFDAIQHRWNKWVLDYSFQTQFTLFERGREALTRTARSDPEQTESQHGAVPLGTLFFLGLGALGVLAAGYWGFRRTNGMPKETDMFLDLKESSRRAGVPGFALHSPGSLTGFLDSVQHPAAPAARRVVDGYIRARFSGCPTWEELEIEMAEALKDARISLRKNTLG